MSHERVKAYFAGLGLADRVLTFSASTATVSEAAAAIGCSGAHIAKTMAFMLESGAILVVLAGDAKVNGSKFKQVFKTKAKMLSADEAEKLVGHRVGGVCPFALNDGVRVYLDESLRRFSEVFPAAGSANSAVRLSLDELERYSNALAWVDVAKSAE